MILTYAPLLAGFLQIFISRRDAFLAAWGVFGLILLLITEALSAATSFAFPQVLTCWIVASALASVFFARFRLTRKSPIVRTPLPSDPIVLLCAGFTISVLILVGAVAIMAPPNNWDAMTYHMARVANWVQHRTVAFYPTPILRQLYLGPFAEFAVAHLQILTGSDRLANLVQFAAMIGNVIGITAIAGKLGASSRGQAVAGLFTATIPMMLLQASNTQTDCVAAFWVVCAINSGLCLIGTGPRKFESFLLAAAVGLAFVTKATTAFILAPFLVWIVLSLNQNSGIASAGRLVAMLIAIPLAINAAQFHRNHATFGRFLTPDAEAGWYQNSLHTPGAIASNLARNVLINTGFRGMHSYPDLANHLVRSISGLDPSDPRITYSGQKFFVKYTRDEHDAPNPIHLLLSAIAIAGAFYAFRNNSRAGIYASCILAGFFLFCFELKWQPWITRLQLPLFVIAAPSLGLLLDRISQKHLSCVVIALLFAQSFIYLLFGFPRSLEGPHSVFHTSRADQYFSKRPEMARPYEQAARAITRFHPSVVALVCGGESWEYALRAQLPAGTGIVHVGVENQSRACPSFAAKPQPQFLVQLDDAPVPGDYAAYRIIFDGPKIRVWRSIR